MSNCIRFAGRMLALALVAVLPLAITGCGGNSDGDDNSTDNPGGGDDQRLAFVQSYWNNYQWTLEIEVGVLEACGMTQEAASEAALAEPEVVDGIGRKQLTFKRNGRTVELLVLYMDTKRRGGQEWKLQSGEQTLAMLATFDPQAVVLADDNAQEVVGAPLADKGTPVVFCGVNADYTKYYADGEPVTGFHERQNYAESFELLKALCPDVERAIFITDGTATSEPEYNRVQTLDLPLPLAASHRISTLAEYQRIVTEAQDQDGTALAIFNLNFEDASQEQAIAWTLANSRLPEVTFQRNTVEGGLLCASTISGHVHGSMATEAALRILDGTDAASMPVTTPPRGDDQVNLLRARGLGVSVPAELRSRVTAIQVATALQAEDGNE